MTFLDKVDQFCKLQSELIKYLEPYMELYKKYEPGLALKNCTTEIKIEDGLVYLTGEEWYCGGTDYHGGSFEPSLFDNGLQHFENHLIELKNAKLEQERLKKEEAIRQGEEYQRKQYEILKKKFESS